MTEKTTLLDIYEAAGARVNEDRTMVTMDSANPLKPFDIRLRVIPTQVEQRYNEPTRVTFDVLLDPEWTIENGPGGGVMRQFDCDGTLTLFESQVRILKEDS